MSPTVTDGIERATERATAADDDRDALVAGGADTLQQCIRLGLLDELQIGIVPMLLGGGLRLFEHLGTEEIALETIDVEASPPQTLFRFRIVKTDP